MLLKEFIKLRKYSVLNCIRRTIIKLIHSGGESNIFIYKNVFRAQNVDLKYKTLHVWDEPQGLAIGFNNNLF